MQGQSRILILVCLSLFLSVFLFKARGYYGGDHFLSYMTAESIVLNRSLCCHRTLARAAVPRPALQRFCWGPRRELRQP